MSRSVAILGASGLVGRTLLAILEARRFPLDELRLLASPRSAARTLTFRGAEVPVRPVTAEAFQGVEIAFFTVRNAVAKQWAPLARAAGACVIDASTAHRYDDDVPLVVPEVNGGLLDARPTLIANPNCSAAPLAVALGALRGLAALERVWVATYQSVSGAGAAALADLASGIAAAATGGVPPRLADGRPPYALNCIPLIDSFEENGYTREEMKVTWELRKLLGLPALPVSATAVRVPVRVGHSAAVLAVFDRAIAPEQARERWRSAAGIELVDEPARGRVPMPLEAAGRDPVLVGRVRRDLAEPRGLSFFVVSDNLRKGAALNAVQIAERWIAAPVVAR